MLIQIDNHADAVFCNTNSDGCGTTEFMLKIDHTTTTGDFTLYQEYEKVFRQFRTSTRFIDDGDYSLEMDDRNLCCEHFNGSYELL